MSEFTHPYGVVQFEHGGIRYGIKFHEDMGEWLALFRYNDRTEEVLNRIEQREKDWAAFQIKYPLYEFPLGNNKNKKNHLSYKLRLYSRRVQRKRDMKKAFPSITQEEIGLVLWHEFPPNIKEDEVNSDGTIDILLNRERNKDRELNTGEWVLVREVTIPFNNILEVEEEELVEQFVNKVKRYFSVPSNPNNIIQKLNEILG